MLVLGLGGFLSRMKLNTHSDDSCVTFSQPTTHNAGESDSCRKVCLSDDWCASFIEPPLSYSQFHISVNHCVQTTNLGYLIEPLYQGGNPQKKCNFVPNARR